MPTYSLTSSEPLTLLTYHRRGPRIHFTSLPQGAYFPYYFPYYVPYYFPYDFPYYVPYYFPYDLLTTYLLLTYERASSEAPESSADSLSRRPSA